ncbi:hypothetical protein BCR44DRAFT_34256 [Catenaria anguillulae PL171]|uniref:Yeast cell wall synthesis Kre9/Knh1-like N-terminal domain-containing protein n=1 Tax=Catenaria anguillulae PL171 TaxID=765915 RepID=A0A1Y2HNK7_9FUNG|nr:hypothetical protein BCR44DRAFT_34256 [Catenaria anguillulae PL171]
MHLTLRTTTNAMIRTPLMLAAIALCLAVVANAQQVTVNTPATAWEAGKPITVTWAVNPSGQTAEPMSKVNVFVMRCDSPACGNAVPVAQIGENVDVNQRQLTATLPDNLAAAPDYFIKVSGPKGQENRFSGKIPVGMTPEQASSMLGTATGSVTATGTVSATSSGSATATATTTGSASASSTARPTASTVTVTGTSVTRPTALVEPAKDNGATLEDKYVRQVALAAVAGAVLAFGF